LVVGLMLALFAAARDPVSESISIGEKSYRV